MLSSGVRRADVIASCYDSCGLKTIMISEMKRYISAILVGLLIAAVWGYFADLRNDQIGWFIGRLVFTPIMIVALLRLFESKRTLDSRA